MHVNAKKYIIAKSDVFSFVYLLLSESLFLVISFRKYLIVFIVHTAQKG